LPRSGRCSRAPAPLGQAGPHDEDLARGRLHRNSVELPRRPARPAWRPWPRRAPHGEPTLAPGARASIRTNRECFLTVSNRRDRGRAPCTRWHRVPLLHRSLAGWPPRTGCG
jgi:hypothetical protein